ncbi:TPA: hypothetical protein KOT48_003686 [Clostridioides difficile]|nr:hypothetical protein [Clostridioides difficile]
MGKYIKVASRLDAQVFHGFKTCGEFTHSQLKTLGWSDTRIKNYCREGHIKKTSYQIKGQKDNGIKYKITKDGMAYAKSNWGYDKFAQTTVGHERHNEDVANKYCSLTEKERMSCLNERELRDVVQQAIDQIENQQERDRYQEMLDNKQMSMPDITYITEEQVVVAYETVTSNYSQEDIQAKMETCTFLKIEYTENRI